ncbi:MAG: helix-turn-helix domain-containing protein [Faecalimonas sp.]|nr:helix-turn-helix domain-containing protein [Faecalimonas sp.]
MNTDFDREKKRKIAQKIHRIRTDVAMETQNDFARALGISPNYVSNLENPNSPKLPSTALLRRIADTYEVNYDFLLGKMEPEKLSQEEQMLKDKEELKTLFRQPQNVVSSQLQILGQNYYKLLQKQLTEITQPNDMNQYIYYYYMQDVLKYCDILSSTMETIKEHLKKNPDIPSELLEEYLQEIKENLMIKENK